MRNIKGGTGKAAATSERRRRQRRPSPLQRAASTRAAGGNQPGSHSAIRTRHLYSYLGRGPPPPRSHECFVAVELRLGNSAVPIWGNLSNTSIGGCFVETATPVPSGVSVEIGLWLANGKIWIKGIILTGIVTKSSPSFGVRIKFSELEPTERENLRHFLKFVESTTKGYNSEHGYLAQLKR